MLTRSCSVWKHAQETTKESSNKSFMLWPEKKRRYYCLLRAIYLLKPVTIFVLQTFVKECLNILPLPQPVLHRERSSASSFNFQCSLLSLRSSSSCLRLLHFSVTTILPSIFPSITFFRRQFLHKR